MSMLWLVILIVYSLISSAMGKPGVPALFWLLLVPMILQDSYDKRLRRDMTDSINALTALASLVKEIIGRK